MRIAKRIGVLLLATGLSLGAWSCDQATTEVQPSVTKDLTWAIELATISARQWQIDARLSGIMAVWVDEDGVLHEESDHPGWGFQFVNGAGTQQIGVTVESDGATTRTAPITLARPVTKTLTGYSQVDIKTYIGIGLGAIRQARRSGQLPGNIVIDGTESFDLAVMVGFNQEDATEDAAVFVHPEASQATDWSTIDWMKLFQKSQAYVFMNAATGQIESNSWEMSLARATRLARATAGADALLTGVMGVWVDTDGSIGEPPDNPGWGFRFTYRDGRRIGITVKMNGEVAKVDAPAIANPEAVELSEQTEADMQNYTAAALSALNGHPGRAGMGNQFDLFVVVGLNLQDRSEDVLVIIEQEEDQAVDWNTLDFVSVMRNAPAWVIMDRATLKIESVSWKP